MLFLTGFSKPIKLLLLLYLTKVSQVKIHKRDLT